jgi:hypothetical protein
MRKELPRRPGEVFRGWLRLPGSRALQAGFVYLVTRHLCHASQQHALEGPVLPRSRAVAETWTAGTWIAGTWINEATCAGDSWKTRNGKRRQGEFIEPEKK